MKKILISLLLLHMCIFRCLADNYDTDGDYIINLSSVHTPEYSVKIPRIINVENQNTYIHYAVRGDIYADQVLKVVFDETTTLSDGVRNVVINVEQSKNTWTSEELCDTYQDSSLTLSHTALKAGIWSGHLNVMISLQGE